MVKNPGNLIPVQIDTQEEWDFYLDVQTKIDLPPNVHGILLTPSAFKTLSSLGTKRYDQAGLQRLQPSGRKAYSLIISNCFDYTKIMQVALPGLDSVGIDVYEDGSHILNYSYNTIEECLDDLSNIIWMIFSNKAKWQKEDIILYTENWFAKSILCLNMEEVAFHPAFSYVHNPELLNLTPLKSIFKILKATIPKDYDSIERVIEITNDLNAGMENQEPEVTLNGILQDKISECQALFGRICVEMDMTLDALELLEGIKFPDRIAHGYREFFDKTARELYEMITKRPCPKALKIWEDGFLEDNEGLFT